MTTDSKCIPKDQYECFNICDTVEHDRGTFHLQTPGVSSFICYFFLLSDFDSVKIEWLDIESWI